MRKLVAVAVTIAALAAGGTAGASIAVPSNNGHPATNPTGHCPPGQNQDATPGALHKCP